MIYIIGIRPGGSINYLTYRALEVIKTIDIAIYVGEMIGEDIKGLFKSKTLISGSINPYKISDLFRKNRTKNIALLMPGDPSLYSGQFNEEYSLDEYINLFSSMKYNYELISGVSALSILCSRYGLDLTSFGSSQNILITSLIRSKSLKKFNLEELTYYLKFRPKIVLYQSMREWANFKNILLNLNYHPKTRILFAYKLSWIDELIIDTTLEDVDTDVKGKTLTKHTIIIIIPYER